MSVNALQAVSVLVDLLTAANHLSAQAQQLAAAMQENGGELSDEQWQQLLDADTAAAARLITAVNRRGQRT